MKIQNSKLILKIENSKFRIEKRNFENSTFSKFSIFKIFKFRKIKIENYGHSKYRIQNFENWKFKMLIIQNSKLNLKIENWKFRIEKRNFENSKISKCSIFKIDKFCEFEIKNFRNSKYSIQNYYNSKFKILKILNSKWKLKIQNSKFSIEKNFENSKFSKFSI